MIRKKGKKPLSARFADRTTANLWIDYKENIQSEMDHFDVPRSNQYTVHDLLILKYGSDSREYKDCINYFEDWHSTPIGLISYDDMKEHCHALLNKPVKRGGSPKTDSGRMKLPSPTTILRKFSYLASSITYLTGKGIHVDNHAIKIVAYLRAMKHNPYEV